MIVIVMGVSGSGKTTVGRLLATQLGWPYVDADDLHPPANVAKLRAGHPLTDADRAPWIDALQLQLKSLRTQPGSAVIAFSGLRAVHRQRLDAPDVRWIWLDPPVKLLAERLASRTDHFMPAALLASQLATMEPPTNALRLVTDAPPAVLAERIRVALTAP